MGGFLLWAWFCCGVGFVGLGFGVLVWIGGVGVLELGDFEWLDWFGFWGSGVWVWVSLDLGGFGFGLGLGWSF